MVKKGKPARVQVPLRIPQALRAQIEKASKPRGVSMNAAIIERLERSFETEEKLGGPKVIELIERIARVMKSTGEHAGFTESGKLTNRGEWLSLPYSFDQAAKAANTILEHYRPEGKIVAPKPNVVEVIGEDTKESKEMIRRLYAEELGQLFALKEIRDKEGKK